MSTSERIFFISHSSKDAAAAMWLVEGLEAGGVSCWIAPRNIPDGHAYDDEIVVGMDRATDVIVLISANANASEAVRNEVALGRSKNKNMVPVRLEDVQPQASLQYHLARLQWIDYFKDPNDCLTQLGAVAKRPLPPPTRKAPAVEHGGDDARRPLTRPAGVYASLFLAIGLGAVLGVGDFEGAYPSSDTLAQALGLGVIMGLLILGPIIMASRWLVAAADRRHGVQPRRYMDLGFSLVAGAAAVVGLLAAAGSDTIAGDRSLIFVGLSGFVLALPIFAVGYFLLRRVSAGKKVAVERPLGVRPSTFERFALFGLIPIVLAAFAPYAIDTRPPDDEVSEEPRQLEAYGLTEQERASLDVLPLVQTAMGRIGGLGPIQRGAENGDRLGQELMCAAYDQGAGVTADGEFAMTWCRRAAEQGSLFARYIIARYQIDGFGGYDADPASGIPEMFAVAEAGDARAQAFVGNGLLNGSDGFTQDDAAALIWFNRAADQGHQGAQFNLAWMFENGRGAPQSYATALVWYERLAAQGSPIGKRAVGWMAYNGWGTPKDLAAAHALLSEASAMGDGNASALLAMMTERGEGVPANREEAIRLYRLADSQGFEDAAAELTRLGVAAE